MLGYDFGTLQSGAIDHFDGDFFTGSDLHPKEHFAKLALAQHSFGHFIALDNLVMFDLYHLKSNIG